MLRPLNLGCLRTSMVTIITMGCYQPNAYGRPHSGSGPPAGKRVIWKWGGLTSVACHSLIIFCSDLGIQLLSPSSAAGELLESSAVWRLMDPIGFQATLGDTAVKILVNLWTRWMMWTMVALEHPVLFGRAKLTSWYHQSLEQWNSLSTRRRKIQMNATEH